MIRKLLFVLAMLLLPLAAAAYQGPIAPPTLEQGRFVYTIPGGYTTAGMNASQLESLEGRLDKLHNPFYVVVLRDLPQLNQHQRAYARSNGFRGDGETQRVEVATAMLMEDWAALHPNVYDPSNSGIFVIAFNPRKFAWHPSLRGKNAAGVAGRAQDQFTSKFISAAKTRPADYALGIANLASAYDEHVFDRLDPVRIAQRREAAVRAAKHRRLVAAQGALDTEITRMTDLLTQDKYLPADVSGYKAALVAGREVRATNDAEKMLTGAGTLKGSTDALDEYVTARQTEARNAMMWFATKLLFAFVLFALLVIYLRNRRQKQRELVDTFTTAHTDWAQLITNAHNRWFEHYAQRDNIVGLDDVVGRTKALWSKTTKQVDDILVRVVALQKHIDKARATMTKGHYFNLAPFKQAINDLNAPFDFDTNEINSADLFGSETIVLSVDPCSFRDETAALFKSSLDGWKRLSNASQARNSAADKDFPHTNMDSLFASCEQNDIPVRWIEQHPLFGDDESDKTFYTTLDELRENDPVAYVEQVAKHHADEDALLRVVARLVAAKKQLASSRPATPPRSGVSATKIMPADDPSITIADARQAEDVFAGMLMTEHDPVCLENQADRVTSLYSQAAAQDAMIVSAMESVKASIAAADAAKIEATSQMSNTRAIMRKSAKAHSRMRPAQDSMATADKYFKQAAQYAYNASAKLSMDRHLDAQRLADKAASAFAAVNNMCSKARKHCRALDAERAAFEAKLSSMESTRSRYARKMRNYGNYAKRLPAVAAPRVASVADYAQLLAGLNQQESTWRSRCRQAERDYDAEQARIRREEERRRRQRREEEAARRRRQSSYTSSSSSSFGGGGFGGGGGGFGGGGFGGSSGSF